MTLENVVQRDNALAVFRSLQSVEKFNFMTSIKLSFQAELFYCR